MDFYSEVMWCKRCADNVNYLKSTGASYCVRCGAKVQFFREEDLRKIRRLLESEGPARRKRSKAS
ncbi:MAG: hypothetical protein JXQ29_17645 [Planctomycetes bacterium]|nr:hypothetical protein [Planctomycetota bacterium]